MYLRNLIKIICFVHLFPILLAAGSKTVLRGIVTNISGESLPGINIIVQNTGLGAATDINGNYQIEFSEKGIYSIIYSGIGFESFTMEIQVSDQPQIEKNIVLESISIEMSEVEVTAKSETEIIKQKGFSVAVIESNNLKNLSKDINQAIKSVAGINIRESGGMGSGFKLSLNGLSGNQIRYFIDGIPMENFGSSLTLNNYPINLIEKLEIYKGVVPVSLGSDALGGAINIVPGYWKRDFVDAAYSLGSFNSHRFSFDAQYADSNGYFFKGSFFFNQSANNYQMSSVPVYDLILGNYEGDISIERFHDDYKSIMGSIEAAIFDKKWSDKLSVKTTFAHNLKNYQHPDNNILRVFGNFHTKNSTMLLSTSYLKEFEKLSIKASLTVGLIEETIVDTSTRKYNWAGEYVYREDDDPKGELFERRSFIELQDYILRSNLILTYNLVSTQSVVFSLSQNHIKREGEDKVNVFNKRYDSPNMLNKYLVGVSYDTDNFFKTIKTSIFLKQYFFDGEIITQDYDDTDIITNPDILNTGFGMALSYNPTNPIQLKLSYEKAYRIPESFEILGDGIYVNSNPSLAPEVSYNFNLGGRYVENFSELVLRTETNFFYRDSKDFIRFNPLGPFGEYENLNNVRTVGVEGSFDLNYSNRYSVIANITYQNLTDQTETDEGLQNTNYKTRIPNVPYLFANCRFGYNIPGIANDYQFQLYWNIRYVQEFFLTWENLGSIESKNIIPSQFVNDFQLEVFSRDRKYNASLAVNNLLDELVYDNFNIQKPGRSFSLKIRYSIN